jgi:hypothetical protein
MSVFIDLPINMNLKYKSHFKFIKFRKERIKMNTLASNNSHNNQISLHSDPNKIISQRKKEQENKKEDDKKQIIHKINFEKMHLQS